MADMPAATSSRPQRGNRRRTLVVSRRQVYQKLVAQLLSRGRELLRVHILQAVGALLIETAPNDNDVPVGQRCNGRVDLRMVRKRVDGDVAGQPGVG